MPSILHMRVKVYCSTNTPLIFAPFSCQVPLYLLENLTTSSSVANSKCILGCSFIWACSYLTKDVLLLLSTRVLNHWWPPPVLFYLEWSLWRNKTFVLSLSLGVSFNYQHVLWTGVIAQATHFWISDSPPSMICIYHLIDNFGFQELPKSWTFLGASRNHSYRVLALSRALLSPRLRPLFPHWNVPFFLLHSTCFLLPYKSHPDFKVRWIG